MLNALVVSMNRYEKAAWIFPALADASPFLYYALIIQLWPGVWLPIAVVCSFAPIVVGIIVLLALPILRSWALIPRRSDGALIGTTLAIIGVIEPFFS
jgi:hypothetical protein